MKVLFVTKGSFGTKDATGSMLNNIFDGLDCSILQYSLRPNYNIDINPIKSVSMLSPVRYSIFSWVITYCNKVAGGNIFWRIVKSICVYLDSIIPPVVSNKEFDIINSFSPDAIYTLAADVKVLRVSRILAKRLRKPIVIHNMDDYYNMDFHSSNIFRRHLNSVLRSEYIKAYKYSHKSLGIGPQMAKEYSEEFGIPFDWVMNCVDTDKIKVDKELNDNLSLIVFSGGLHGGRSHSLSKIARIVEGLGDVKLEIYTSKQDIGRYNTLFVGFKRTELHEYVEKDKMFENLSRADVLLHVESFEPQNIRYFRLSMSTKIPEYMAVCRPILCVGPENMSTVDFIKEQGIGYVVNDFNELEATLIKLKDKIIRKIVVDHALIVFEQYFRKEMMQQRLRATLYYNTGFAEGPLKLK